MNEYLFLIFAYILGSIPFGLLVSKLFKKIDIREHGSGNIGATNVMRKLGVSYALPVLLLDMGKGAFVIGLARHFDLDVNIMLLSGFIVVIGHCFPVFLRFKGGKGVATALGVLLFIPDFILPLLAILFVFIIIVAVSRYVSLASITAVVLIPAAFLLLMITDTFNYTMHVIVIFMIIFLRYFLIIRNTYRVRGLSFKDNPEENIGSGTF